MGGFSGQEHELLWRIAWPTALLSALCCLLILFFSVRFKTYKRFSQKLIILIAANDLGQAVSTLMGKRGKYPRSFGCQLQAYTQGYFGLTSMLWSCSTAFTMHMVILEGRLSYRDVVRGPYLRNFFIFCQIVPAVISTLPFSTGSYGNTGAWCWVQARPGTIDDIWRLLGFYIWIWVGTAYCWYIWMRMERALSRLYRDPSLSAPLSFSQSIGEEEGEEGRRRDTREYRENDHDDDDDGGEEMKGSATAISTSSSKQQEKVCWDYLKYYPLALVCAMLFASINRVYQCFGEPLFILSALQVATESLQGAFDCIPFFLTPDVRRKMYSCVIGCTDLEQEEQERETESSSFTNYIDHSSSDNSKSNMVHVL